MTSIILEINNLRNSGRLFVQKNGPFAHALPWFDLV